MHSLRNMILIDGENISEIAPITGKRWEAD